MKIKYKAVDKAGSVEAVENMITRLFEEASIGQGVLDSESVNS